MMVNPNDATTTNNLGPTPPDPGVTAEILWAVHRAAISGRWGGAPMPEVFEALDVGVQVAHWAMALTARRLEDASAPEPPRPLCATPAELDRARAVVLGALRAHAVTARVR